MRRSAAAPKSMSLMQRSRSLRMQFWGFMSRCTMPAWGEWGKGGKGAHQGKKQQYNAVSSEASCRGAQCLQESEGGKVTIPGGVPAQGSIHPNTHEPPRQPCGHAGKCHRSCPTPLPAPHTAAPPPPPHSPTAWHFSRQSSSCCRATRTMAALRSGPTGMFSSLPNRHCSRLYGNSFFCGKNSKGAGRRGKVGPGGRG